MSQNSDGPTKTFTAGAAIALYLRVYLSAGKLAKAGVSNVGLGTMATPSYADGDVCSVRLKTSQGTHKMVASDAISAGSACYAGANGKVASTGTIYEGIALEASTTDGDVIEVMSMPNTDVSSAITSTTGATFVVDSDVGKPKTGLKSQTGGTGDYVAYYQAPSTMTADRTYTGPGDASDTLCGIAATQTLTNKTLTSPVIATGLTASGSAANTFAGSTGTFVTSTGLNTLSGYAALKVNATPVAAAGSTVSDAGALNSTNIGVLSSDGATKGVKLPTGVAGQFQFVINSTATACELYAASGGTVNGLSADASIVVPASKGVLCLCTAADTWIVYDLPAKATAS